jgi:DNA (cytosine-5)-methyltransferase 1
MLHGVDLFSGIGGITLGLSNWVRPIAYCEKDKFAQSVLLSRIADGQLPRAPIWDDVTSLTGSVLPSGVEIIYGGFPCQDISTAGLGAGLEGKRSGLFSEIIRLTKEVNPKFVFLENVPAIRTRGLSTVIREFTKIGYDCRWTCLSAASLGAPHKRERWFLLAHSNRNVNRSPVEGGSRVQESLESKFGQDNCPSRQSCGASSEFRGNSMHGYDEAYRSDFWKTEPSVGRMVDGLPNLVDRNKSLGNAVAPLQVEVAFKRLMGLK